MGYKPHPPAGPLLVGYDPFIELSPGHLARLVDRVVDACSAPEPNSPIGCDAYDPALLGKILLYAYATGTFSSRRIVQNCNENLAYLFLTRGAKPCFKIICTARISYKSYLERVWLTLLATASELGIAYLGKIAIDATRIKANTSSDLVLSKEDYDEMLAVLHSLLSRAELADKQEKAVQTETGVEVSRITVRTVVRSLGKDLPEGELTSRGQARLKECIDTLEKAQKDGLKHVSLSDPDARMMPLGSRKTIGMGHGLEVAVDSGMVVAGKTTSDPCDTGHLFSLVEEAALNEDTIKAALQEQPVQMSQVLADSGYFDANDILDLQEMGLEVVVPDSNTVHQMRTGPVPEGATVRFERIEGKNAFRCPQGNILYKAQTYPNGTVRFRASKECTGCPLAQICLQNKTAKRRSIRIRAHSEKIVPYLANLLLPAMMRKYDARGPAVETVFAFIRQVLGFKQWMVRGAEKISAEAELLKCAYQVRKVHSHMLKAS